MLYDFQEESTGVASAQLPDEKIEQPLEMISESSDGDGTTLLITLIVVLIAVIFLICALVAFVLYKRERTRKKIIKKSRAEIDNLDPPFLNTNTSSIQKWRSAMEPMDPILSIGTKATDGTPG